ncbi:transketolase family protein [Streptomyces varsoviensis]|nr:transketolase C-terminal domain-containing protein [Streptomyces varsoviensis]
MPSAVPTAAPTASMRPAVARVLTEAAHERPGLVVLGADGHGLAMGVRSAFPERYIDVGIAEPNLVGVASGLARAGHAVVVGTMAPFLVRRAQEQIRNDVCNPNLDVTFLGVGGGLGYGTLGPTHHAPEDLGSFAAMPNTLVLCPADATEAAWAVREALDWPGPAYVRLGAREDAVLYPDTEPFDLGRGRPLRPARDALALAMGAGVAVALRAADLLAADGVGLGVLALSALKPFPADEIRAAAASTGVVAVVEEHLDATGLAARTALALAGTWRGRFLVHALDDRYPPVGDRAELLAFYGVDARSVGSAVRAAAACGGTP